MCTLIWKPTQTGILVGSNRDEWPGRGNASLPDWNTVNGTNVFAPIDPAKGGSWFACIPQQRLCVILNGGFIKHTSSPPYKMSRGIILMNALTQPIEETLTTDFTGIEPFTLVIRDFISTAAYTLVWTGETLDIQEEDWTEERVWSSATLYDESAHEWAKETTLSMLSDGDSNQLLPCLIAQEFHAKRKFCHYQDSPPIETMASITLEITDDWEFTYTDHIEDRTFKHSFLSN